jgi:two-component system phosphate regulon response regulator PhoB
LTKILVIENDLDTLDILGFFLTDSGFEVLASQKTIPIEKIISDSPDIILLDYFLDDGYGKDMCLELKANALTGHIPVILISAHNKIKQIAIESCADAYLAKPFDLFELENLVRTFVSQEK